MQSVRIIRAITHKGLDWLESHYGIHVNRSKRFPNLVHLKYDQIKTNFKRKTPRQARGIILDEADNWRIVCYPYDKFFNYGEGYAARVNWKTARVYEKIDGTMIAMYYYQDGWHISTTGTPDADGEVNGLGITFAQLFWNTWKDKGYKLPEDTNLCYIFELCTQYNQVVIYHPEPRIVMHGARHLGTTQEYMPEPIAEQYGWECVETYPIGNMDQLLDVARELEGDKQEGFVVCDANFNRIKVKSPDYVLRHHLNSTIGDSLFSGSLNGLLKVVLKNEGDELIAHYPQWQELYDKIKRRFVTLEKHLEKTYAGMKNIKNDKAFAEGAKNSRCPGVLFNLRRGKAKSVRDALAMMHLKHLTQLLKLDEISILEDK